MNRHLVQVTTFLGRVKLVLFAAICFSGCSHLAVLAVHDDFDGMRSLFESSATVSLLIVHGMGDHPPGYSNKLQQSIAARLDLYPTTASPPPHSLLVNGYSIGTVNRSSFVSKSGRPRKLNVVELSWSEATRPIKSVMLDLDERNKERGFLESRRLPLNSLGKQFVNTYLSDPVLYVGSFGAYLRTAVIQSLCHLYSDKFHLNADPELTCTFEGTNQSFGQLVIISSSLGSPIVFDSLVELFAQGGAAERIAAQRLIANTKRVYMFANQLPLIELRALDAITDANWLDNYPCPTRSPNEVSRSNNRQDGLSSFLTIHRGLGANSEELNPSLALTLVAFSDPNDLLTYRISDRFKERCKPAKFANVTVTNAESGWLFIFADPMKAHSGFAQNETVMELIVNGHSSQR